MQGHRMSIGASAAGKAARQAAGVQRVHTDQRKVDICVLLLETARNALQLDSKAGTFRAVAHWEARGRRTVSRLRHSCSWDRASGALPAMCNAWHTPTHAVDDDARIDLH